VELTRHLAADRRTHIEARLHSNLIAWLTTVRPDGQPVSVPVWFVLRDDETNLIYRQPNELHSRTLEKNPLVTLALDVTDLGRDVIRLDGTAEQTMGIPSAADNEQYVAKYTERIGAMFGTADRFAALFSDAVVITPSRLWA
jgi:PPOX class probable F420-dependent enzyme